MKRYLLGLAVLFLLMGARAEASFTGPYTVYTLELLDAGDVGMFEEAPGNVYLYPHVYAGGYEWRGPGGVLEGVLGVLRTFKPKLYKGVRLMNPIPEDYSFKSVTVMTDVKTEIDFKILMSEVVTTFNATRFLLKDNIPVKFHFKNSRLEKKYGGKEFWKKDVPYAVFVLRPPKNKRAEEDSDANSDEIEALIKALSDLGR